MDFLINIVVIFAFIGVAFILINIRQIFTGQEFRGTCASNNPMLKDKLGSDCSVCGKKAGEPCKEEESGKPAMGT